MKQIILYISSFLLFSGLAGCTNDQKTAPILILGTNADFGTYTCEILKTEGFNEFDIDSPTSEKITKSYLRKYDLIILAETKINDAAKKTLKEYMNSGGNMIAFRPDSALAELFGIIPTVEKIGESYIGVDTSNIYGRGLTSVMMQIHGTSDKYLVNGCETIATFFTKDGIKTEFPAVVSNKSGRGKAIGFLYNLPKSIVYTRQGNPLFAGIEKDGIPGLRGLDLFTDGWLDNSRNAINQADEQMALLSHCIEKMNISRKPLPRFWYFPDTLKCLVTLTNDGEFRSEADFEPQFRDIDSMGAKMTLYILEVGKVSKPWVDKWTAKGFEIAGHPDDTQEAPDPDWNNMNNAIKTKKSEIASAFGLPMRTNVNHWFVWCGIDSTGKQDFGAETRLEEMNGIELDINYAHYDIKSNQGEYYLGQRGINQGNFTGSGLVMKYADVNGKIINVYQHLNAVYDQQYNESKDPEGFYNCFKGLMDRSLQNEVYSFISIKAHNDEYYFSKQPLLKMLSYSNSKGIPVWTAEKLLDFVKMKDEATFTNIKWSDSQLSFDLNSSLKHSNGLTFMLPLFNEDQKIKSIIKNGENISFIIRSVKGIEYAFASVTAGKNYSIKVNYDQ